MTAAWLTVKKTYSSEFKRTSRDLVSLLEGLAPGNFTTLYDEIFARILDTTTNSTTSSTIAAVQNLLFWVTHQLGPMTKAELRIACAMSAAIGYPDGFRYGEQTGVMILPHLEREPPSLHYHDTGYLDEAFQICTPLLRTTSSSSDHRFTLAHDSLRGYITTTPPSTAHGIMSAVCINYLLFPCFDNSTLSYASGDITPPPAIPLTEWEAKVRERIASYEFVSYAATRWLDHLALSSSSSSSPPDNTPLYTPSRQNHNLKLLLDPRSQFMTSWTEVLWYHTKLRQGPRILLLVG